MFADITKNCVMELLNQVLTFLGLIGVLVDPTTAGLGDSERAMGYAEPWDDNVNKEIGDVWACWIDPAGSFSFSAGVII